MIGHLVAMLVSAVAFFGAILLYGAFSPRRLKGWKFWLCFAVYCALMEGAGPLANGLYSACGILGGGVGRQTLYNVTRYLLLYVLLFRERSMVYLSTTVIFYSWICCIETLVVGATLILQADAVRLAVQNSEKSWLFWINQLLVLCGCAAIRKAHPYQPQTNGSQNRFAISAIISLVSMAMTARLQNGYYQGEIDGAFLFYFAAVLLFSDVMTFVLIVWNEKDERLKGENLTLTARARTQAESIEALSASYTAQRKLTHEVAAQINGILHDIQTGESAKPNLQEQLEQTQQEFDRLLEMSLDFDEDTPFLDDRLKKLNSKIKSLKKGIEDSAARQEKIGQPEMLLSAKDMQIQEYDDTLTARIIEKITVRSRNEIEIRFIGGYKKTMQLI